MIRRNKDPEYLYLHVPFCESICYYCDFCHVVYNAGMAEKWLDAVSYELEQRHVNRELKTIYIGGGTPTSLSAAELEKLLCLLDPYRAQVSEYTVEVNPGTLDDEKADILKRHGVNRVSIGMQSGNDELLKAIGRKHTFEDVRNCIGILRNAGIGSFSLDIMYGLPGQTMQDLDETLADALSLEPGHLSLYSLTIPENTVFARRGVQPADEDLEADMYEHIVSVLTGKGYEHYEISNFALPGCRSLHNQAYWRYDDFYGIGAGASGKEDHIRYDHPSSLKAYLEDPMRTEDTPLTVNDEMFENLMMSLRMREGLDMRLFQERYGFSFEQVFGAKAKRWIDEKCLIYENQHVRCTEKGMEILNTVLADMMDEVQ